MIKYFLFIKQYWNVLFNKSFLPRPEIDLRPWGSLLKDLEEGNRRTKWVDREPYAYWKGNPVVADTLMDLLKCNVSDQQDWNARVYAQVLFLHSTC